MLLVLAVFMPALAVAEVPEVVVSLQEEVIEELGEQSLDELAEDESSIAMEPPEVEQLEDFDLAGLEEEAPNEEASEADEPEAEEEQADPEDGDEAEDANTEVVEAVSAESEADALTVVANSDSGEVILPEDVQKDLDVYEPEVLQVTIKKNSKAKINNGDTLLVYVSGKTVSSWSSSKTSVASVVFDDEKAIVSTHKVGSATLTAKLSNKKKITLKLTVADPYLPTSIALELRDNTLYVDDTRDLNDVVSLEPYYARTTLSWKSSSTKVASVSKAGILTAKKAGKAKITVTTKNKKTRTVTVKVLANKLDNLAPKPTKADINEVAGSWTLWPKSIEILSGGKIACEFYLLNGTGSTISQIRDLDLSLYHDQDMMANKYFSTIKVSCKKKSSKVFKVTYPASEVLNGDYQLPNHSEIEFTYDLNEDVYAKAGKTNVMFTPGLLPSYEEEEETLLVTSVTLNKTSLTLTKGSTETLTATVKPDNATNRNVNWTTSNPSIATVNSSGKVTAVAQGTATITATAADGSGKKANCSVTVTDLNITRSGSFDPQSLTIKKGEATWIWFSGSVTGSTIDTVTINGKKPDGSAFTLYTQSQWNGQSSFSDYTLTIDAGNGGDFSQLGTYNLNLWVRDKATASISTPQATMKITVVPNTVAVTSVTLNKTNLSLSNGQSETLIATVMPDNATNKKVNWSSSNTSFATVDANGKVTAKETLLPVDVIITATAADGSGKKASCTVTVIRSSGNITRTGSFNPTSLTVTQGSTSTIKISGTVSGSTLAAVTVNGTKPDGSEFTLYTNSSWGTSANFSNVAVTVDARSGGIFNQTGTYTLNLWVRDKATASITTPQATMTVTVKPQSGNITRTGSFNMSSLSVTQGNTSTIKISGSVTGSTLAAVTVNGIKPDGSEFTLYTNSSWGTSTSFSGLSLSIDARSGGTFNQKGTYKLNLWVRDKATASITTPQATMTVIVEGEPSSVSLTVRANSSSGSVISNGQIIDWPVNQEFRAYCSQTNGNGKYLVKSYVMSGKPNFNENDVSRLVTGVAYQGSGYYYGRYGNDEFGQSTMNGLPFNVSDCSIGQYVKIWIGAEGVNYASNHDNLVGVQFALKLTSGGGQPTTGMDWCCWLTSNKVKAGGMVCVKLKANNVKSFYVQLDGSVGVSHRDVFDAGVINRLASICLRVPTNFTTGKHTVTVVCSDSYIESDPNANKETRKLEYTVGELELSMRWPFNEDHTVGQHFGARDISGVLVDASKDHKGVDIGANSGTSIYAAAAGTVEYSGWNGGYGNYVRIAHANGVKSFYGHMNEASILKKGDTVKAGDLVGYVGSTGTSSGPHLHFGVIVNGKDVDPLSGYITPNSVRTINFFTLTQ